MTQRVRSAVAVLVLSLACLACGGGGGHGSGPTEPAPPAGKQFQFSMGAQAVFLDGGLLEVAALVDGREVARMDFSRGGGSCSVACGITGRAQNLSSGTHAITFTVVRQTRAVTEYLVAASGVLSDAATGSREVVNFPPQRMRLRAGESVTFTLRV